MGEKRLDAFGPVLRRLQHEKNLMQDKLSEMVGVASSYISMLESGHNYPNLAMLFKLADVLEIEAWEMVKAMRDSDQSL